VGVCGGDEEWVGGGWGGGGGGGTWILFVDAVQTARDDGFGTKTDKTSVLPTITKTFSQQQPPQNKHSPFSATLSTPFLRQADALYIWPSLIFPAAVFKLFALC